MVAAAPEVDFSGQAARGSLGKAKCSDASASAAPKKTSLFTIPTILTLLRLLSIPPVVFLFGSTSEGVAGWVTGIFIVAALTDWLDGYLARKWDVSTPFGAFLDPVADKLMVGAVLVMLCTKAFSSGLFADLPWLMPALSVTILSRELAMSSLREWAATMGPEARGAVAVSNLGKYKTACQMVSLSMLLFCMNGGSSSAALACAAAGPWLLIVAAFLTVYSFAVYFVALARFMF